MLPKIPVAITILDVPLGSTRAGQGGFYARSDATVTAELEAGGAGAFRIVRMETDDVVQDPDGLHGSIPVLQFAGAVNGPGPIAVSAGQALLVTVEFACPADPPSAKFTTGVAVHGFPAPGRIPVSATAALGRLEAISLDSPPMLPGGNATFHFRVSSSRGRDVPISFVFDTASAPQFSAPAQSGTVPAGGNML
jgi:hypothetical protein